MRDGKRGRGGEFKKEEGDIFLRCPGDPTKSLGGKLDRLQRGGLEGKEASSHGSWFRAMTAFHEGGRSFPLLKGGSS